MTRRGAATEPGAFLARLSDDETAALTACGRRRRWPRGANLFTAGERSDQVVVVLSGRAKVSYYTEDGKDVVLAFRGPGTLLGELAAIDEEPRSATVCAMEPVEALTVPAVTFTDFLQSHPHAMLVLLRMLSQRLRDADRKRIEFGAYDTLGRVAQRLVELADRFGEPTDDGVRILLPFTQEELAGWVGSSREAVAKSLRVLRGRGYVRTQRQTVFVVDLDALRRRAV